MSPEPSGSGVVVSHDPLPNVSLLLADVDGTLVTRDKVLTDRAS
jgi:hypothetical protein